MLGKLLKHEWKSIWKIPVLLIGILMITAVIAGLTFALPIWESDWIGLPLSGLMLLLLFYFAMIAASVGITVYMAVRCYKSMFTDEGYLTHTLPVSSRQILNCKVITMSVWTLITGIAIIISLVVFGGVTFLALSTKSSRFAMDVMEVLWEIRNIWESPMMKGFGACCVSLVCFTLVSSASSALILIGAITLGQKVRGHRILGAVGAYFGITTIVQIIAIVLLIPLMVKMVMDSAYLSIFETSPFSFYTSIYWIMTAVYLVVGVGLYFMSDYMLRRQLELE